MLMSNNLRRGLRLFWGFWLLVMGAYEMIRLIEGGGAWWAEFLVSGFIAAGLTLLLWPKGEKP
jgi:hypothetical protein